jgi:hypothetical protein
VQQDLGALQLKGATKDKTLDTATGSHSLVLQCNCPKNQQFFL